MKGMIIGTQLSQMPSDNLGDPPTAIISVSVSVDPDGPASPSRLASLSYTVPASQLPVPVVGNTVDVTVVAA